MAVMIKDRESSVYTSNPEATSFIKRSEPMNRCFLFCVCVVMVIVVTSVSLQACGATVVVCGDMGSASLFAGRAVSLGYTTEHWSDPEQVSALSLVDVDVLFVHSCFAPYLASKGSVISSWVAEGHGLIVEQPNQSGNVEMLPPGLEISVFANTYDSKMDVQITSLGQTHPITLGLTTDDLSCNADRVLLADVSSAYDILGVQMTNPNYVALAAAFYGDGRVVFHTGNTSPTSTHPGSDQYVKQMIDWSAGVPEPSTLALLGIAGLNLLFWRKRRGPN